MNKFEKEIRFLKIYSALLTAACTALFGLIIHFANNHKFEEIDLERINVVEADGELDFRRVRTLF